MFAIGNRYYDLPDRAARLLRSPGTWAVLIGAAVILPFLEAADFGTPGRPTTPRWPGAWS